MTYVIRKDKHNQYYWVGVTEVDDKVEKQGEFRHEKLQGALDDCQAKTGPEDVHVIYVGRTYGD